MTEKNHRWLQALRHVTDILTHHGIVSFLDTGTLLGAVRDKAFIPWDNDIDISVKPCDFSRDVMIDAVNAIYRAGFNIDYFDNVLYLHKSPDIDVGIMLYQTEGGNYTNFLAKMTFRSRLLWLLHNIRHDRLILSRGYTASYKLKAALIKIRPLLRLLPLGWLGDGIDELQKKQINIPCHYFDELEALNFYGQLFHVPKSPELYLSYRYGSNWCTPIEVYNYITDDQSLS